jgi:hypothetical protein
MTQAENDERARLAAHVLLDMLSAWDGTPIDQDAEPAVKVAAARLTEVGAVQVLRDDETEVSTVNITPVLRGALDLMTLLSTQVLAHRSGIDGAGLISGLRTALDGEPQPEV